MTRLLFAIPGDLYARTGGYAYDRRLIAALPGCGVEVVHCALPGGFPNPSAEEIAESVATINGARRAGDVVVIDGLAFGALPASAIRAISGPIIALCHHPLCLETGLDPERSAALRESEQFALALASQVIVTSSHTGVILAQDFAVPERRITVATPGTDFSQKARGSGGACALLAVGAIIPRKAIDLIIEALAGLVDLDWRLRIVGGDAQSPPTGRKLDKLIEASQLGERVERLGEISSERLDRLFHASDLFVSASHYEGFGMALAEALAHGLPIVMTTGGAAADTVPDSAAIKVAPGDIEALRDALRRLIVDSTLRSRLAEASWREGQALPRWEDAARIIARVALGVAETRR
jgi:glycosyltransferase involved in cell wall biosynthesis